MRDRGLTGEQGSSSAAKAEHRRRERCRREGGSRFCPTGGAEPAGTLGLKRRAGIPAAEAEIKHPRCSGNCHGNVMATSWQLRSLLKRLSTQPSEVRV